MDTSTRVPSPEHPHSLVSMDAVAATYLAQGRWSEAEEIFTVVLAISSKVLGKEHPHTLINMVNLAPCYRNQARWQEAEELVTRLGDQ